MKQKLDLQNRYNSLDLIKLRRQLSHKVTLFRKIYDRSEAQNYWSSGLKDVQSIIDYLESGFGVISPTLHQMPFSQNLQEESICEYFL